MKRFGAFSALAGACLLPFAAQAQPADPAPCELHVWPGTGLASVYSGWFHGGLVNGAVDGREGYPEIPRDPIATAVQVGLLEQARPQALLRREDYRLVVHANPLTSREIRNTPGRIEPAGAACYAELIVDDVVLRQDTFTGDFLTMMFRFRDFGSGPVPTRTFGTWVKTRLLAFPPKSDAGNAAALAELRSAYTQNIALFFTALLKKPKR